VKHTPLHCIFVGARNRGSMILDLFTSRSERYAPVALVDVSEDAAAEEIRRRGWNSEAWATAAFGSLEAAVEQIEADACVITSPARFHGSQMRCALEAGLNVFVESPMTYDLDEAVNLVELAESRELCIVVDQYQRYSRTEQTLAEWIRERRYGEVGFVSFSVNTYRPEMGSFTSEDPFIWEQGAHSFDSLIAILRHPVKSVTAFQMRPFWSSYNGATVAMGVLEFESSIPCHYLGTFDSRAFGTEIRFEMEKATVRALAESSWEKRLEVCLPGKSFEPVGIEDSQQETPLESHAIESFFQGCTEGGRVANDGRENLRTLAAVDAFVRSSRACMREEVRRL
jgi:predicted dehydrogenase